MKRLHVVTGDYSSLRDYHLSLLLAEQADNVTLISKDEPLSYNGGSLFSDTEILVLNEKILASRVKEVDQTLADSPSTSIVISTDKMSSPLKRLLESQPDSQHDSLSEKKAADTIRTFLTQVPLSLSVPGREMIVEHVGESVDEVIPIIRVLSEIYAPDEKLSVENIQPYLGTQGLRLIWRLTDAIDMGNTHEALYVLNSVLRESSPHAVMGLIQAHFKRMFYLSTTGKPDPLEDSGKKESYPVIKARKSMKRYGSYLPTCYSLVSDAVMNMRGLSSIPPHLTIEILVSRLCAMKER